MSASDSEQELVGGSHPAEIVEMDSINKDVVDQGMEDINRGDDEEAAVSTEQENREPAQNELDDMFADVPTGNPTPTDGSAVSRSRTRTPSGNNRANSIGSRSVSPQKPRSRLSGNGKDANGPGSGDDDEDEDDDDLFGDRDNDDVGGEDDDRRGGRNALEYDEEEGDDALEFQKEEIVGEMVLPKIPKLSSTDGQSWILRLPPSVHVDSTPFHPQIYRETHDDAQVAEDEEATKVKGYNDQIRRANAMNRMHNVQNTIRWKWTDGSHVEPVRKSNARIVKWSDGSSSLQIGDEMWDVDVSHSLEKEAKPFRSQAVEAAAAVAGQKSVAASVASGGLSRFARSGLQSQGNSQPDSRYASPAPGASSGTPSGERAVSIIYATDSENQIFVADSIVTGQLGLIPASENVRNHQRKIQTLTKSTTKQAKIQSYYDASGMNPDQKAEAEIKRTQDEHRRRLAEKNIKETVRMAASWGTRGARAKSPSARKAGGGGAASTGPKRRKGPTNALSSDEDEEDEYEQLMGGRAAHDDATREGSYEEDDFVVADSEDDDAPAGSDEEEEGAASDSRKRRSQNDRNADKKRKKNASTRDFDTDEEDDEEEEAEVTDDEGADKEKKKSSKRKQEEEEDVDSELEKADRAAEKAEEEIRRQRAERKAEREREAVQETAMQIDDDEDDERVPEQAVPPTKKRVLKFEESDEE